MHCDMLKIQDGGAIVEKVNCCPLRPASHINKQNGGETRKFINSDFRAFCLKKYTIGREDMLLKLKFNYSSKLWLF